MPVQVSQKNSFPPKIASNLWFSDNFGGRGKQQPTVALETNQLHRRNSETSVSCLENTALLFDCFSLKAKFGYRIIKSLSYSIGIDCSFIVRRIFTILFKLKYCEFYRFFLAPCIFKIMSGYRETNCQ